mmetsp:Transcript_5847/g.9390  ORF Transcript_5847/g.9390 Transcript_5847/m.9390 type:complete len:156 (-) Transcript_5847:999-1466(-)
MQVTINNKQNLYDYFVKHFSKIFFTKGQYVQEQMKVVGPIRLRTVHTVEDSCKLKSELNKCYKVSTSDSDLYKEPIDGIPFSTCSENEIGHTIFSEGMTFPCSGHKLDVFPADSTPEEFIKQITDHKNMLFGDGSRGLNLEITLYLPRADYWVYI